MTVTRFEQVVKNGMGFVTQRIDTEIHLFGDSDGALFVEMRQYDRSSNKRENWKLMACSKRIDVQTMAPAAPNEPAVKKEE